MSRTRILLAVAAAGLVATGALASAIPVADDSSVLTNAVIPLKGGSGGGSASIQIDWKARKVCYAAEPTGLNGAVTGALVKGSTTVVAFKNARNGEVAGCSDIDPEVAKQVIANPTDYAISIKDASTTLLATLSPVNNFK
ncbi:MAG: hypothetical protein J7498_06435 [Sphingobium sp.]|nr:hypothetical protein [Sphingobium sp.]